MIVYYRASEHILYFTVNPKNGIGLIEQIANIKYFQTIKQRSEISFHSKCDVRLLLILVIGSGKMAIHANA